eukprot:960002-Amphidinium_carterae.1
MNEVQLPHQECNKERTVSTKWQQDVPKKLLPIRNQVRPLDPVIVVNALASSTRSLILLLTVSDHHSLAHSQRFCLQA